MNFIDIILDTIHDTWAMLPLLYVTYCVLEVFERKNTQDDKLFFGLQRLGPILGALVGLIPQCGFSILAAMLFVQNNITLGTLVSVMIATSDEAIPILISNPKMYSSLLGILGLKLVIAIIVGSICSVFVMQLSWYVSLIPTGVVYYILMKTMKSSKGFRKGTIFED